MTAVELLLLVLDGLEVELVDLYFGRGKPSYRLHQISIICLVKPLLHELRLQRLDLQPSSLKFLLVLTHPRLSILNTLVQYRFLCEILALEQLDALEELAVRFGDVALEDAILVGHAFFLGRGRLRCRGLKGLEKPLKRFHTGDCVRDATEDLVDCHLAERFEDGHLFLLILLILIPIPLLLLRSRVQVVKDVRKRLL